MTSPIDSPARHADVFVIEFPGTTCAAESQDAFEKLGFVTEVVAGDAFRGGKVSPASFLVIPGGFTYGDGDAPGRVAARRYGEALRNHRGPILGICNGFQILCETGMLKGRLDENPSGHFESRFVGCTLAGDCERRYRVPIAHRWGRYSGGGEPILHYAEGGIAGVIDRSRRIAGIMPHPERAVDERFGSADGLPLLREVLAAIGAVQ